MGWTHYWERDVELPAQSFEQAVNDCRRVLAAIEVRLAGHYSEGEPVFSRDEIAFNGVKGQDCETFVIRRVDLPRKPGRPVFSYCKTEKLPYDLCVRCALVILKHHLGDNIKVTSDGTDEDWKDARNICNGCLGYGLDINIIHGCSLHYSTPLSCVRTSALIAALICSGRVGHFSTISAKSGGISSENGPVCTGFCTASFLLDLLTSLCIITCDWAFEPCIAHLLWPVHGVRIRAFLVSGATACGAVRRLLLRRCRTDLNSGGQKEQ